MPFIVLQSISIIKGQMAGDEFYFDHEFTDPETGSTTVGVWKSAVEKANTTSVVRNTTEIVNHGADSDV